MSNELPDLSAIVLARIQEIPSGAVVTYGQLAEGLGDRAAARWVGELLARSEGHPPQCVCHRVVRKTGELGRYAHGEETGKYALLVGEGVPFRNEAVWFNDACRYDPLVGHQPLVELQRRQQEYAEQVRAEEFCWSQSRVAAVDVAYPRTGHARAAYVEMDWTRQEVVWSAVLEQSVRFPYIPGYLSFRELPPLEQLLRRVSDHRAIPELILVDGNGRLHPRRAGIASMLGVAMTVRTVGVGKSLLCGSRLQADSDVRVRSWIVDQGDRVAAEMSGDSENRTVFVSPGHRIDLPSAVSSLRNLWCGHRLPEPIYWADRLSRRDLPKTPDARFEIR